MNGRRSGLPAVIVPPNGAASTLAAARRSERLGRLMLRLALTRRTMSSPTSQARFTAGSTTVIVVGDHRPAPG